MEITKADLQVVDLSIEPQNDNYLHFTATAGYIGKPTSATPCGANKGFKVILGDGNNVGELVGAGVNCSYGENQFKAHNKAFKIGVIDNAVVNDGAIAVEGHLWKTDFPDVCDTIECSKDALGCSVEIYSFGVVVDDKAKTQTLNDVNFTGMSIVYKSKAAFDGTGFMCSIKEDDSLTEQEIKEVVNKKVEEEVGALKEALAADFSKQLEEFKTALESPKEEAAEKEATPKPLDFTAWASELLEAVKKVVTDKAEATPKPQRKTQQFASEPQFKDEKSLLELSKEIDKDESLSVEQKWAAQMRLWNENNAQAV